MNYYKYFALEHKLLLSWFAFNQPTINTTEVEDDYNATIENESLPFNA